MCMKINKKKMKKSLCHTEMFVKNNAKNYSNQNFVSQKVEKIHDANQSFVSRIMKKKSFCIQLDLFHSIILLSFADWNNIMFSTNRLKGSQRI